MPTVKIPVPTKVLRLRTTTTNGGRTALEAHARLDVHELQIDALAEAVDAIATGQGSLTSSVSALVEAVNVLERSTKMMSDSMVNYVADTTHGREMLTKMVGEVLEKKTGNWALWLGGAAVVSADKWLPFVWKLLHAP